MNKTMLPECPPRKASGRLLSVIVPARNEAANLPRVYAELTAVLATLPCRSEVLLIDNASTDATSSLAAEFCARDRRWRYIRFSRDFGVEASLAAGFRFARGDAAVVLFSDLQDPPELIPTLVRYWEAGNDVVYGVLRKRGREPWWKPWAAQVGYRLLSAVSDGSLPVGATDFRLLSRRAINVLNRCKERYRYFRGLAHWIGLPSCAVPYERRPRTAGHSKATPLYLLNFLVNALTCFSLRPLQAFSVLGFLTLGLTMALTGSWLSGWLPQLSGLHLLSLLNLTVLLLGTGMLGEYVGRAYLEGKRRPLYVIERAINFRHRAAASRRPQRQLRRILPDHAHV